MAAVTALETQAFQVAMGDTTLANNMIADINLVADVTAGTVSASKAVVVDSSKDVAGIRTLTLGTAASTLGTLLLSGSTSGTVGLRAQAAAGSITFDLPAAVGSNGQQLTTDGTATNAVMSWAAAGSMPEFKNILGEVSDTADKVLERVVNTAIYAFKYKTPDQDENAITTRDFNTTYTGVMADEAPHLMHYDGKIFNPVSAFGECVLAIKGLYEQVSRLKAVVGQTADL